MSRQSHVPVDPRHFSQSGHPDHEFEGASSPSRGSNRPKRPSGTTALRTAIACRACRDRKTRCSGDQPSCRYCSKAGIACEYASGSVAVPSAPALPSRSLDEWGDKILQAVDSLAQGLQRSDAYSPSRAQQRVQGRDRDPITPIIVDQLAGIDNVLEEDQVPFDAELHHRSKRRRISDSQRDNASYNSRSPVPLQGPTRITSSLSILSWPALFRSEDLATYSHKITSARATLCLQRNSDTQALTSASCETSDLLNLLSCFAESILPTIPVIDLGQVRRMISRMDEYGVPWNGEACLVLLVAALGSIYQPDAQDSRRRTRDTSQISSPASSRTRTSGTSERITSTTLRYWNMARKRLSWAMNTAGRLSTQCQLLAGLYLVHSSEPLAAWKMLTSALISLDDQQTSGLPSDIAKIETERRFDQQIRMAILTLLCRLRFEIQLPFAPGSVQLSSEDHFPNQTEQENGSLIITSQTQADILRIRGNASVNSQLFHPDSSIADLQYLQTKITSLLSALEEWRTRLPFAVKLDSDTSVEHRDSHLDIHHVNVRKQMQDLYYETKELILRPSLYLVLHSHHLHGVQAMAPGEGGESRTFEDLLATHLTTQLQDMVAHHRLLLLERTRLFLGASQRGPRSRLPEVGWLKHQTCFTLALLLIASSRVQCDCGGSLGMGLAGINDAVGQVIDFLTHDDLGSEESRIAADILRKHHGASDGST